jgi:hypothetical protein
VQDEPAFLDVDFGVRVDRQCQPQIDQKLLFEMVPARKPTPKLGFKC